MKYNVVGNLPFLYLNLLGLNGFNVEKEENVGRESGSWSRDVNIWASVKRGHGRGHGHGEAR